MKPSGIYTPNVNNVANITDVVVNDHTYFQVGDVVHVSGSIACEVTASAADVSFEVTLPVTTAVFTEVDHLTGMAQAFGDAKDSGYVEALDDGVEAVVKIDGTAIDDETAANIFYSFSYKIRS